MSLFIDVVSKYPDAAELGELYRAAGFELYLVVVLSATICWMMAAISLILI